MNSPTPPHGFPPDTDDDDQQWFELMAGRSADDVKPATRSEAAWLRAGLLAYTPQPLPGTIPNASERAERLVERARQAGVLPPLDPDSQRTPMASAPGVHVPPPASRRRWRDAVFDLWPRGQGAGWGMALAGLAAVWLWPAGESGVSGWNGEPPAQRVERGQPVQQLADRDPATRQEALLQTLRASGLDAQPFEQLGRLGVDVALPERLSQAQQAALRAQGLQLPAGPSLRVELLPAAPASGASP